MPYNLLLLPLLGGYLFLRWWNPTRYHALRAEKERLLILAAIPGLISLILAFAIVKGVGAILPCSGWPNFPCFPAWWKSNVPFDYLGTSLLAFALGASVWWPWNKLFCSQKVAIDKVIDEDKIPFELLLKKAQDQTKTVSVTMSNGKVYVGWVTHSFNPALPTRFIQILPIKSGYRNQETKWLEFTTFYSEALDQLKRDVDEKFDEYREAFEQLVQVTTRNERRPDPRTASQIHELNKRIDQLEAEIEELETTADDFDIVVPVSEIMSINVFSEYVHSQYFTASEEDDQTLETDEEKKRKALEKALIQAYDIPESDRLEYYKSLIERFGR